MPLIPLNPAPVNDNVENEYDLVCKFIVLPLMGLLSISIIYFNQTKKQKYN